MVFCTPLGQGGLDTREEAIAGMPAFALHLQSFHALLCVLTASRPEVAQRIAQVEIMSLVEEVNDSPAVSCPSLPDDAQARGHIAESPQSHMRGVDSAGPN